MANRPSTYKKHKLTEFEKTWGISRKELAKQDNVTADAISMRIRNFGNPWQRKKAPNQWEAKYGRSLSELSELLDIHPVSVALRDKKNGNVFIEVRENVPHRHEHSFEYVPYQRNLFWLHENHPDYAKERAKLEEFKNGKKA